jgi:hypothetical protein
VQLDHLLGEVRQQVVDGVGLRRLRREPRVEPRAQRRGEEVGVGDVMRVTCCVLRDGPGRGPPPPAAPARRVGW